MNKSKHQHVARWMLSCVAALCFQLAGTIAIAQPAEGKAASAHQVVEHVTERLTEVTQNQKDLLESNPQAYYQRVKEVLEPVVDFQFIAGSVMGPHWQQATPEQRKRFVETFQNSLVETYAKGMANYSDLDIKVLPPSRDTEGERRVSVVQEITGPDGTNRVSYTMAQNREGEWKLINMVLNGVNLGKTFRNQFAQAVKQRDGNLDAVIANWSAET